MTRKLLAHIFRNLRHSTMLSTYKRTHLHSQLMSLFHALALQDASTEGTREAIACTYGISDLYLWSLLERNLTWGEEPA